MNRFIGSSPVVTTNNYYTIADLHNLQSLHTNLLATLHFPWNFASPQLKSSSPQIFKSRSLRRSASYSSSAMNFPCLSLTANCLPVLLGAWLYSRGTDTITWNTSRDRCCCLTSPRITETHVTSSLHTVVWRHLRMRCIATVHARTRRKHFRSIVAWSMR
jgi:hypothetical protein